MNLPLLALMVLVVLAAWWFRLRGSARDPGEVQAWLQQGARVIDVRTPNEFARGHLPMAMNLPLDELADRLPREIPDRNTPLLLHCASGARSAAGKRVATDLGYRTVRNLGSYNRAATALQGAGSGP